MKNKFVIKLIIGLFMISISFIFYNAKNFAHDEIVFENAETNVESMDENTDGESMEEESEYIIIDISGEVVKPQILELKKDNRVFQAINKAGGITNKADITMINLASQIKDEQKIYIPSQNADNLMAGPINFIESTQLKDEVCIYVSIYGEIANPSVVKINDNARIFNVVDLAGGLTEKADTSKINLAEKAVDGMKILIPNKDQVAVTNESLININTANTDQLKTLSGVGDATAKKIIDYRNAHGFFEKPEDIMNVTGIGESKYSHIKDDICTY